MLNEFTRGETLRDAPDDMNLHSGRVTQAFSSKNLCIRPRMPMGISDPPAPTAEQARNSAATELETAINRLELAVFDSLFSRTTAHYGEHRVFKTAFTKFDTNLSGTVDIKEFTKALECLGLHTAENGLPGQGGVPQIVVNGLFARYDTDGAPCPEADGHVQVLILLLCRVPGSGEVEYTEFYDKRAPHLRLAMQIEFQAMEAPDMTRHPLCLDVPTVLSLQRADHTVSRQHSEGL